MTPRTRLSLYLLALLFFAQEFWQIWKHTNREVNWWIAINYKTSIQWYFKDLGTVIWKVIMAYAYYRVTFKIPALRSAAIVVLIFTLVEFVLFFVCYNRAKYALIYSTIGLVVLLVVNRKYIKEDVLLLLKPFTKLFRRLLFHRNIQPTKQV